MVQYEKWIQKYRPKKRILTKRKKINQFIIDETLIKINSKYIQLWVVIEPKHRQILQIDISFKRNMFIVERFLSSLIKKYGKYHISTDGGRWHPQACEFLKLRHHTHSPFGKSVIERTINISKTEPRKALMTIFHAKRKNAN